MNQLLTPLRKRVPAFIYLFVLYRRTVAWSPQFSFLRRCKFFFQKHLHGNLRRRKFVDNTAIKLPTDAAGITMGRTIVLSAAIAADMFPDFVGHQYDAVETSVGNGGSQSAGDAPIIRWEHFDPRGGGSGYKFAPGVWAVKIADGTCRLIKSKEIIATTNAALPEYPVYDKPFDSYPAKGYMAKYSRKYDDFGCID